MKKIIVIFSIIVITISTNISYSQLLFPNLPETNIQGGELIIYNQKLYYHNTYGGGEPNDSIKIKFFPVGAFFNGNNLYSPKAKTKLLNSDSSIAGKEFFIRRQPTNSTSVAIGNFDRGGRGNSTFAFGYGKYRIEFYKDSLPDENNWKLVNYVYIDFRDAGTHYGIPYDDLQDIRIDYFTKDLITFQHYPHNEDSAHYLYNINDVSKDIKMWELHGTFLTPYLPEKGMMIPDSSNNSEYLHFPLIAKSYNGNLGHENPGNLGMNLKITDTVSTRDSLIDTITNINVTKDAALLIGSNMVFNMITPVSPEGGYNNLIIEDSATGLVLYANAKLNVYSPNWLTFKSNSYIRLVQYSEINIFPGATLCNEGATVIGLGRINFINGVHQLCSSVNEILLKDSAKIVLSDSTVLEIPDNTILHFTGIKSGLLMKPNSKLKLGVGCKIIFDSSASLIANGATFTSIDSTLKWDGIVLSNSDADSITNCTFSNAVTALTITNDANSAYKNRIITNNTFNIPSGGICEGIYGENNYKILLKGNTFNMPVYFPSASPVPLIYVGVYLKNSSTIEAAGGDIEEDQSTNYSLNIIENTFSNGCASVILANYTSNYLPYIISDNTFNNTASVNFIGMKISGTIRDNNFTSEDVPLGIHLINSSPNLSDLEIGILNLEFKHYLS